MPSENITIRSGINPSKFMGSAHAAGSSLEERVGNNERKITLLKNIINYKDNLLPIPKPEDSDNTNLNIADRLDNIGEALGLIGGLFKLQLSSLQDKEAQDLIDKAEQDKKAREAELEAKKATKSKPDSKLKIPKLGFFETLKKFFLNVALGAASLKLIEWFKNPENREKILSFTNFLKDNAKAIFTTLAALVALDIAFKFIAIVGTLKVIGGLLGALMPFLLPLMLGGSSYRPELEEGKKGDRARAGLKWNTFLGGKRWDNDKNKLVDLEGGNFQKQYEKFEREKFAEIEEIRKLTEKLNSIPAWDGSKRLPVQEALKDAEDKYRPQVKKDFIESNPLLKDRTGAEKFMAKGGRPPVGEAVTVGEQGRELFVADTSGTIIPNDKTEHVFDGGALLVAKSSTMDKVSSISQRVDRKRTPNLIDLRGKSGGSSSNPTFNTGDQLSSVPSEDSSNIDLVSGSLVYGLVG